MNKLTVRGIYIGQKLSCEKKYTVHSRPDQGTFKVSIKTDGSAQVAEDVKFFGYQDF